MRIKVAGKLFPFVREVDFADMEAELSADGDLEVSGGAGGGGGVTDHGNLTGLADDDHPQYAMADGSRGSFATTAQGSKADSALQPADIGTTVQTQDDDLDTISALDSAQTGVISTDGAGWIRKTYAQLKTALGLGNVDNTADVDKPVSTAQQTALDGKQDSDADLDALAAAGNSGVLAATTASFTTADETKLDSLPSSPRRIFETAQGTWTDDAPGGRSDYVDTVEFVGVTDPTDGTNGVTTPANIVAGDRWTPVADYV